MTRLFPKTLLALASAVSLLACSDPPPPETPAPTYEGPWAPLTEEGDWKDPGPFAPCSDLATGKGPSCDGAPPQDPSCDPASLGTLERQGAVYRAEIRLESYLGTTNNGPSWLYRPDDGGFKFDASGQLVSVMTRTTSLTSRLDSQTFFVSSLGNEINTSVRFGFTGCRAISPRELTGCFTVCRSGVAQRFGSFRAERMTWRQGEAESSGGLQLVSESFVQRGRPVDVFVTKGHAYVVSLDRNEGIYQHYAGGLTVYDVSDPRNPVLKTSLDLNSTSYWNRSYWNGVWARGDALYVASDEAGVLVFDISNPAQPSFVRGLPNEPSSVHTVHVSGDRLYAMAIEPNTTLIYDVSNPLQPQELGRYTLPTPEAPSAPGARTDSYPHDSFEYQGRLYLNHLAGGFAVVDVSNPAEPALLGRYRYPHVFSHATAVGTFNGRTIAFEGGETLGAHLRVLDVTDPANIVKIGEHKLRNLTSIHNMLLVGTRLYVAWYHEGVRVLDVSDPSHPREVAHYNTYRETDARRADRLYEGAIGIRVPGDGYVYVIDNARGLLVFNEL